MPTFVILMNFTEKGIKKIKEEKRRQKDSYDMAKSIGAEVKAHYYTLGKYDQVAIVEAPSIEVALKGLFWLGQGAVVRTETLVAVSAEEVLKIIDELPEPK
jgi:uncharacterized protein with GYD domain